jgi:hypothetical protein
MKSAALAAFSIFFVIAGAASAAAQTSRTTPAPIVTAESETWYLAGEPITYSGHFYYPSGAQIHFNANEMVRSGFYDEIPLYSRTTLEPYSIVFVPVRGGMMQPYERRRDGELAGTAGSTTPSLPTTSLAEDNADRLLQAAAPPALVGSVDRPAPSAGSPVATGGSSREPVPAPTSTSGRGATRVSHVRVGPNPQGVNAIFMDFGGRRWYASGAPIAFDPATMARIGERHGFAIFADSSSVNRIYIQVVSGGSMVAPYSTTRPSSRE